MCRGYNILLSILAHLVSDALGDVAPCAVGIAETVAAPHHGHASPEMALNNEKRAAWYTEYAISTGAGAIFRLRAAIKSLRS